jgi:hypothetical protein
MAEQTDVQQKELAKPAAKGLPAGVVGLMLVLPGVLLRFWLSGTAGSGGIERATNAQIYAGGASAILVLISTFAHFEAV